MKVVLASANQGKLRELASLLAPLNFELSLQKDYGIQAIEETGLTFIENAILKARHAAKATGYAAIADDSGLIVPKLQGRPGIYSARFAGPDASMQDNIAKLLAELKDAKTIAERLAYFYCVIVFLISWDDPTPIIAEGYFHGAILQEPRGQNGFGYDPIFLVSAQNCSAAELPTDVKNKISHRALAVNQLIARIKQHDIRINR